MGEVEPLEFVEAVHVRVMLEEDVDEAIKLVGMDGMVEVELLALLKVVAESVDVWVEVPPRLSNAEIK